MSRRRKYRNQFYLRRCIIPLNIQAGRYSAQYVDPLKLNELCTAQEIQKVLDEIHYTTKNMAPIRIYTRFFTWSLFIHFFLIFTGLIIRLAVYRGMEQYNVGLYIILSAFGILLSINVCAWCIKNNRLKILYNQINLIVNKYRESYEERGLRWEIMKSCMWIELWNDNKLEIEKPQQNSVRYSSNRIIDVEIQHLNHRSHENNLDNGISTQLI